MKNLRRIIVIGANGRLGAALAREYQGVFSVKAFARSQLDLGKLDQVRSTLSETEFDLLLNCAALTNVDYCESHSDEAFLINAQGPRLVAEIWPGKICEVGSHQHGLRFRRQARHSLYRGGSAGSLECLCRIKAGRRTRGVGSFPKESRRPTFLGLRPRQTELYRSNHSARARKRNRHGGG